MASIGVESSPSLKGPAVSPGKLPFLPWEPYAETGQIALAEHLLFTVKVIVNTLLFFLPVSSRLLQVHFL